jgi:hypothetical protein
MLYIGPIYYHQHLSQSPTLCGHIAIYQLFSCTGTISAMEYPNDMTNRGRVGDNHVYTVKGRCADLLYMDGGEGGNRSMKLYHVLRQTILRTSR